MLRQAIEEHALETGGGETPVDHFIEWLAEWGRDIRRRQRGLLLLTAHRAKGLEFDHVAVLDGGWDRVGNDEDPDAPRRLYYVAMTRARQTLTLASLDGSRGFPAELVDHAATIRREVIELPPCSEAVYRRHVRPTLQEVDLGFAGRRRAGDPVHRAIAALSVGDPLTVRVGEDGTMEVAGQGCSNRGAPRQVLRAAIGDALPVGGSVRRGGLEPRGLGPEISRRHEMRRLGGGRACTRIRAGWIGNRAQWVSAIRCAISRVQIP